MEEKAMKSDETSEWMVIERRKKPVLAEASTKRQSSESLNILKKAAGKGKQNNENRGGITAPLSTYSKIFGEKGRRVTNQTSEKISEIKLPPKDVVVVPKAAETTKDITKPLQITKKDEKTASKPKKKIALFDVLLASTTTAHQQPPPSIREAKLPSEGKPKSGLKLHSNALRNLETVFEPKKFVQVEDDGQKKRKRKKQISTFKKKILRERMRMHIRKQIELKYEEQKRKLLEEQNMKQTTTILEKEHTLEDDSPSTSIRIYNFANDVNWEDESEKDEIIADIKAVVTMVYENHQHTLSSFLPSQLNPSEQSNSVFHHISSLSIWKWKDGVIHRDREEERFNLSFIDIKFKNIEISQLYLKILNDMVIGGDSLRVFYSHVDHGDYVRELIDLKYPQLKLSPETENLQSNKDAVLQSSDNITENRQSELEIAYTVIIENVIQDEDEIQESDDVDEILHDVYSLCESISLPNQMTEEIHVTPRLLWVEKSINSKNFKSLEFDQSDSAIPPETVMEMKLNSWKDAYRIYDCLDDEIYRIYWYDLIRSNIKTDEDDSKNFRSISALCDVKDNNDIKFGMGFINFLSREEYDDEDERLEIIDNLHALFSSTTALSDLTSTMTVERVIFKQKESSYCSDGSEKVDEAEADSLTAYLILSGITFYQVMNVYQCFNEMIISGQALKVEVIGVFTSSPLLHTMPTGETSLFVEHTELRKFSSLLVDDQGSQVLVIRPQSEKFDKLGSHEDEINEKQRIIDKITRNCEIKAFSSLERLSLVSLCSNEGEMSVYEEETNVSYQVCLQFARWREAVEATIYFDQLLLGGSRLAATMTTSYSNHETNSGRTVIHEYKSHIHGEIDDHFEVEEVEKNSGAIGSFFDVKNWQSYFDCVYFEYFFLPTVELRKLNVEQIDICFNVKNDNDIAEEKSPEQVETKSAGKKKKKKVKVQEDKMVDLSGIAEDDLIAPKPGKAIYTVGKQVPKAGIRDAPLDPTIRVANEEINLIVKEFLTAISHFQSRLKEENPTKWKTKMRYVVGMKQVLQQLEKTIAFSHQQALKCKLILIAPNTELNEELDEKLQKIISLAKEADVPILYCLSKRLLGKALQMTIKQSIVAIIDPNGIYDLFKKIVHYATA